jgi:hypothetical protein
MDPISLTMIVALVAFVLALANGRGFWKALSVSAVVMVAGFVLTVGLAVLAGLAAGLSVMAALASIILAPVILLLSPVLVIVGLIWLAGYAKRNPV